LNDTAEIKLAIQEALQQSEGETAPSFYTIRAAEGLVDKISQLKLQQPGEVYTGQQGELIFVWRGHGLKLEAWLLPSGEILNYFSPNKGQTAGEVAMFDHLRAMASR
jgi:hypothetical protein